MNGTERKIERKKEKKGNGLESCSGKSRCKKKESNLVGVCFFLNATCHTFNHVLRLRQ